MKMKMKNEIEYDLSYVFKIKHKFLIIFVSVIKQYNNQPIIQGTVDKIMFLTFLSDKK